MTLEGKKLDDLPNQVAHHVAKEDDDQVAHHAVGDHR